MRSQKQMQWRYLYGYIVYINILQENFTTVKANITENQNQNEKKKCYPAIPDDVYI